MYPFGSGMPQATPPQNQYQSPTGSAPFGAGWVQPSQPPTHGGHPSQHSNAPYPTGPSYPYPSQQPSQSAPYPSYGQAAPAANYPSYPGSSYPHNPQHQNHAPYPPSSTNASSPYPPTHQSPYPPAAASVAPYPTPSHHQHHQGYPPQMSSHQTPYPTTVQPPQAHMTPGTNYSSATNMAKCFGEMSNRQSVVRKEGLGMSQGAPLPQNQYQSTVGRVPFGVGWVLPNQPSMLSYQYPSQQAQSAPYPSYGQAFSPSISYSSYPGSSFPQNPQLYTPQRLSSADAYSPYPPVDQSQHAATAAYSNISRQQQNQSYPPPSTSSDFMTATNITKCFGDMNTNRRQNAVRIKGTPTVVPAPGFDPVKDAHALRKAMKGFGTDEDALIEIICRRTNDQRQEIQRQYKTHFGKDLVEDIKSETSGNFEKLLVGLLRPIVDFYCYELCDAMKGIGTDEDVLVEILCTLSNMEIHTIKNQYLRMYGAHLESELKSETSGNFKRLLVSLCTAARDESGHADPVRAQNDARELLKAGELRVGTDESTFNMVLCQRNYAQLKMIFQEYENMTGHTLEKAIKREFSGDIQDGLLAIYKCVTNKAEYFASRLHKSMAGIGTNDKQLIRVIITRCEIDLQDIKVAFERIYGKSLKSWIKGDTSGHYKHALYALIGEQRSS